MPYEFYLDSSTCTGCKACQAACKDRNGLAAGVLWRRVYEVSGGSWERAGQAWTSSVFAYNLSISCNHCEQPICVEVCPTGAYSRGASGIVLLQSDKCMGCQYCTWACPYGAPQYDPAGGRTSKCDLCVDELLAARSTACVAACPLRALELREVKAPDSAARPAPVFPLPSPDLTSPMLRVKPHPAASRAAEDASVANREEVARSERGAGADWSLVLFTVLGQMAVGALLIACLLAVGGPGSAGLDPSRGVFILTVTSPGIALLALLAIALSFLHLGSPANAWRALTNLSRSWLSREILAGVVFAGASWLLAGMVWLSPGSPLLGVVAAIAVAAGLGLVGSMSGVYRLRTIPPWNSWLTPAAFAATTACLGPAFVGLILITQPSGDGPQLELQRFLGVWMGTAEALSLALFPMWLRGMSRSAAARASALFSLRDRGPALLMRLGPGVFAVLLALVAIFGPASNRMLLALFAAALASELVGRFLFYRARVRSGL